MSVGFILACVYLLAVLILIGVLLWDMLEGGVIFICLSIFSLFIVAYLEGRDYYERKIPDLQEQVLLHELEKAEAGLELLRKEAHPKED